MVQHVIAHIDNLTAFCTRIHSAEKVADLTIKCKVARNYVSQCVIDKLNLHIEPHPHSYKVTLKKVGLSLSLIGHAIGFHH